MTHDGWLTHDLPFAPDADAPRFERREWLLTNGTGAYAMGTALGRNTRRYHGLLVATPTPPVARLIALHQVLETLVIAQSHGAEQRLDFTTCGFLDGAGQTVYAPRGFATLTRFRRSLSVSWHHAYGPLRWSRTLTLHDHEQAATLSYRLEAVPPGVTCRLELAPMLTLRGFHELRTRDAGPAPEMRITSVDTVTLALPGVPAHVVTLHADDGRFEPSPDWWYGLHYPVDARRGQGDREDHFVPGRFIVPLHDWSPATLTVALGTDPVVPQLEAARRAERLTPMRERLAALADDTADGRRLATALTIAADDFVVRRSVAGRPLSTILAGYPWFADWGRDTFIALPGLMLTTGRLDEARAVLRAFAAHLRRGLVPNRFDDHDPDAAHYNTLDGSMWFVHAALRYLDAVADDARRAGEDTPWVLDAVAAVVDGHLAGTAARGHDGRDLPIGVDPSDMLLAGGDDRTQLTWMDAAAHGPDGQFVVFTPRPGKPVEVNALWVSNLRGLVTLLDGRGATHPARRRLDVYRDAAHRAAEAFVDRFWSDELNRLLDHVRPDGVADATLRPNQCIAAALPRCPLTETQRAAVVESCAPLLTFAGLRTLPADDREYHPHYAGPAFTRDGAYHRGTVWPWLIGPYAEALLRSGGNDDAARRRAAAVLAPLLRQLTDPHDPAAAIGQLHEVHEADAPHAPRGCPAQAWSIAELLRVWTMTRS